jgi:Ni/Co efflux regulator RcnB
MKRTLSLVLVLALLEGSAAMAQPNYPDRGYDYGPRYSRGDRLPDQYRQDLHVVSDWRQRGLQRPPRGYQWVANGRGDMFLASRTTGVVAQSAYRD